MRSTHCSLSPTLLQPRQVRQVELFRTHQLSRRRHWRESRHIISAAVLTPCNQWPDPEFVIKTKRVFPQKGIADAEEARVLFSSGYTLLDVRAELDCQAAGRIRGSVHIPILQARSVWSAEEGKKLVVREPNPDWLKKVLRKFPNKHTPLLVAADEANRQAAKDALKLLDRAGYACLVELRGGFDAWNAVFDFKMNRRRVPSVSALLEAAAGQAAAAAAPASQAQPASQALPSQEPTPAEALSQGPGSQELWPVEEAAEQPAGEVAEQLAGEPAEASAAPEANPAGEGPNGEEGVGAVEALAAQRLTFEEVEAARAKLQRALELSSDDEEADGSYGQVEGRGGGRRLRQRPASPPPTRPTSRSLRPSSRPPTPPARPPSPQPQPEEQPQQPQQPQQPTAGASAPAPPPPSPRPLRPSSRPPTRTARPLPPLQPSADIPASSSSPISSSSPASSTGSSSPEQPPTANASSTPPRPSSRPVRPSFRAPPPMANPPSSPPPPIKTNVPSSSPSAAAAESATPSNSPPTADAAPASPQAPAPRPPRPSSRMPPRAAAPLVPPPEPGTLPDLAESKDQGAAAESAADVEASISSPAGATSAEQPPASGAEGITAGSGLQSAPPPQVPSRPLRPSSRMRPLASKPPSLAPAHGADASSSSSTSPAAASAAALSQQSSRPLRPSSRMPPLAAKAPAAPAASADDIQTTTTTSGSDSGSSDASGSDASGSDASGTLGGTSDGSSSPPVLSSLEASLSAPPPSSSGTRPLAPAPSEAPQPPARPPRPSSRMPLRTAKADFSQALPVSQPDLMPIEAAGDGSLQAAAASAPQELPASPPAAADMPPAEPAAAATAQGAPATLQHQAQEQEQERQEQEQGQQQEQQPVQAPAGSGKQGSRWESLIVESGGAAEGQSAGGEDTSHAAPSPIQEQPQLSSSAQKTVKLPRRLDNIESGFYICPELLDKVAIHLAKNFLALPRIKTPLILGIWGAEGQGKAFQCGLAFRKLGVAPIVLSGAELASGTAGDPSLLLRQRYLEAAEAVRNGRMCALLVSDLGAGEEGQPGTPANSQAVHATMMELAGKPTELQLPGGRTEVVPRVPIVCTGSDFSTLYAPLIEDGQMEKFYWNPTREDRISICLGIFQQGGLSRGDAEELVDAFSGQPIQFFSALRSKAYDDQVREWIAGVGVENLGDQLMGSLEGGARFEKPGVELATLLHYGQAMLHEVRDQLQYGS